jgi:hypothetical protein
VSHLPTQVPRDFGRPGRATLPNWGTFVPKPRKPRPRKPNVQNRAVTRTGRGSAAPAIARGSSAATTPRASTAKPEWAIEAIRAVKTVMIRLIDRGQVTAALFVLPLLALLAVAIRAPKELVAGIVALLTHPIVAIAVLTSVVAILLLARVVGFSAFRFMQRNYMKEIDRMADQKRALELRLEPGRPRTYVLPEAETETPSGR